MKILRGRDAQCNSEESIMLGPSLAKCGNRIYYILCADVSVIKP